MTQDVMQVCLSGHVITDCFYTDEESRKSFCTICGELSITKCKYCQNEIPGRNLNRAARLAGAGFPIYPTAPEFCKYCGNSFPWANFPRTVEIEEVNTAKEELPLENIGRIFNRFHVLARQLLNRHEKRSTLKIENEYDVQDFLHVLLKLFFYDIRSEEWTPSLVGKSDRMDFLLVDERTAIETKMMRSTLTTKQLGTDLLRDIASYREHPNCSQLIIFIYDPEGRVVNPDGFIKDLEKQSTEKLTVKAFINPK